MKETMTDRIRKTGQYLVDHAEDFVSKTEGVMSLTIAFDVDLVEAATIRVDKEIVVIEQR